MRLVLKKIRYTIMDTNEIKEYIDLAQQYHDKMMFNSRSYNTIKVKLFEMVEALEPLEDEPSEVKKILTEIFNKIENGKGN
jgi:uncharacterized coiled-coil DUF342 family protein